MISALNEKSIIFSKTKSFPMIIDLPFVIKALEIIYETCLARSILCLAPTNCHSWRLFGFPIHFQFATLQTSCEGSRESVVMFVRTLWKCELGGQFEYPYVVPCLWIIIVCLICGVYQCEPSLLDTCKRLWDQKFGFWIKDLIICRYILFYFYAQTIIFLCWKTVKIL